MSKKKKRKKVTSPSPKTISESTINKIFIGTFFLLMIIFFAPLLSGAKMMYGSDWLISGYSVRKWAIEAFRQHKVWAMWDPNMFCGIPAGHPYSLYTLFYLFLPIHVGWTYIFVFSAIFAGLGAYLYLKELNLSIFASFVGAIAYMGCGNVLSPTYGGHDGRIVAMAFIPFVFLFWHKALTRHKIIYFLLAGGISGIASLNGHPQYIYYTGIVCAFYFLFHLIWQRKENKIKGTLILIRNGACALLLTLGLIVIHFSPILGTLGWGARGGERGYEFATSWALPPIELLDLLTPHFSGILDNYWGENYFKLHTEYIGILPLLLGLIAIIFYRKEKYVRFFIVTCILTTIFALGGHTPLYKIPYYIIPMIKKFRGPSMIFGLTSFGISILSAFGVQVIQSYSKNLKSYKLLLGIVFGVTIIFILICAVGKETILSLLKTYFQPILVKNYGPGLAQQKMGNLVKNYPLFLKGLGIAVILVAINSGAILLLLTKKLKPIGWVGIIVPILIIDQWSIQKKFLKSVPHPNEYYDEDEVVRYLKRDTSLYRVFPLYYEHARDGYLTLHNIQTIGGYGTNPGERYQKFIGAGESVMFNPFHLIKCRKMLDILNVKYIISAWFPEDLSKYPENVRKGIENLKKSFFHQWKVSWEDAHKEFKLIYRTRGMYGIYKNENALPRAWVTHNFKVLTREEILSELMSPNFRPEFTILLEEKPTIVQQSMEKKKMTKVEIEKYTPNKIICNVTLDIPGFLILSENWHPEWKVYVDGEERKLYVANYILRAVEVEEGTHKVEFVFCSMRYKIGSIISLCALSFFIATIVFWYKKERKK